MNQIKQSIKNKVNYRKQILITGGAGFIGSHLARLLVNKYPDYRIINLDSLTYAGNLNNLKDIESKENYVFVKGDINDSKRISDTFNKFNISDVIHLAAESHVDRSITGPLAFVQTNVIGTVNLLECCRSAWNIEDDHVFYHVSTDEVFGSLGEEGLFDEMTAYDPRSPYSASKAASDHFVRAYAHTYGLKIKISNCSNNYGPYQFPEKLIPLMINNIVNKKSLPVYGAGENVRDWLYVEDHAMAIDLIFHKGLCGETYCVGGQNEMKNIDIVYLLCDKVDQKLQRAAGDSRSRIQYVTDRAGHDYRYAIDTTKISKQLKWSPAQNFKSGIEMTIDWYLNNPDWLALVTSGDYMDYYNKMYQVS
ncbi:UNVERIFIED_CONTAM: hypothetical protein GTU68_057093 [Idotea baltica]|nr:hypothetical protein [Idotea baltica]